MPNIEAFVCYDPGIYLRSRLTVKDLGPGDPLVSGEHLKCSVTIPEVNMRNIGTDAIWRDYLKPALDDLAKAMNRVYDQVKFQTPDTDHNTDVLQQVAGEIPIRTSVWYVVHNMTYKVCFDLKFIAHRRNSVFIVERSGEGIIGVYSDRSLAEDFRRRCFAPEEILVREHSIQTGMGT